MRDNGERVNGSARRRSPEIARQTERRALREALTAAAAFGGIMLIGEIFAILLIAVLQMLGLWSPA